jgi:hypothetical protein
MTATAATREPIILATADDSVSSTSTKPASALRPGATMLRRS